jgi:thiamine-phosphate pyrophosphorylase
MPARSPAPLPPRRPEVTAREGPAAAPQLFLTLACDAAAGDRLAAALEVAAPASVLLAPADAGPLPPHAAALVAAIQARGIAALVLDDARRALDLGADGVHLAHTKDSTARYRWAREFLGPRLIVGADAGASRHDAMVLGEEGADYVAFGLGPDRRDRDAEAGLRLDLVAWWAELFEVPCVALDVERAEEAAELARAGADFIGVALPADEGAVAAAARLGAIAEALRAMRGGGEDQ